MNVVSLVSQLSTNELAKASAQSLLKECAEMEPIGVIIFAYLPDRKIFSKHSGYINKLEILGALEAAKIDIWQLNQ